MKILVSEAVEVIYHCHDWTKREWSEGKFGKSLTYTEECLVIRSERFDDVFKIYKSRKGGYIAIVDGLGYSGKTVKEAVEASFAAFGKVASFEFKIGA